MSRYAWAGISITSLPSHCEKVATYWATLVCFYPDASGRAVAMKYKAVRAFKNGLRARELPEAMVHQAFRDTQDLARLKMNEETEN